MRERQERMEIMLQDIVPRVVRIEEIVRKQRRNSAGMLVMMQATASDFNERVSLVEERLDALEAHPA